MLFKYVFGYRRLVIIPTFLERERMRKTLIAFVTWDANRIGWDAEYSSCLHILTQVNHVHNLSCREDECKIFGYTFSFSRRVILSHPFMSNRRAWNIRSYLHNLTQIDFSDYFVSSRRALGIRSCLHNLTQIDFIQILLCRGDEREVLGHTFTIWRRLIFQILSRRADEREVLGHTFTSNADWLFADSFVSSRRAWSTRSYLHIWRWLIFCRFIRVEQTSVTC